MRTANRAWNKDREFLYSADEITSKWRLWIELSLLV